MCMHVFVYRKNSVKLFFQWNATITRVCRSLNNVYLAFRVSTLFYMTHFLRTQWRVQTTVALVDQAFGVIRGFLRNSRKYGLGSLRKTPTKDTPPMDPGPTSGQLASNLQKQRLIFVVSRLACLYWCFFWCYDYL